VHEKDIKNVADSDLEPFEEVRPWLRVLRDGMATHVPRDQINSVVFLSSFFFLLSSLFSLLIIIGKTA
jgi:hypothetical protein